MDKYKLAIILGYFGLAVIASAAVVLIIIFRPDATATIINYVGTIMAVASTGAVTFYMLGSQGKKIEAQGEKIEKVEKQTNGANTALRQTISEKDAKIEELQTQLLAVVGAAKPAPKR